ncbi:MAG: hypothetical protein JO100_18515 [Pseudonocardia sp.]|nr:hypothetical protein [Pseudonocardia sp.]
MNHEKTQPQDMLVQDPREPNAFNWDLIGHELRRVAAVLSAMPDWCPVTTLAQETEAYRMLMFGLDDEQRMVHHMLIQAGVLDA